MKKKIWIINHYANSMFFQRSGRHYYFAKYLKKMGYEVDIFCSNKVHNSDKNLKISRKDIYKSIEKDDIQFNFIKSFKYDFNIPLRLINIFSFSYRLKRTLNKKLLHGDVPDVILASSVHPWAVNVSLKIGRRHGIKVISEFRDLWPESLIAYGIISKKSLIAKYLYRFESRLFKNSSKIIYTMPNAKKYLADNNYTNKILLENKIKYISNGVDYNDFLLNSKKYVYNNEYNHEKKIKITYVGSLRKANGLENLIYFALKCQKYCNNVVFYVIGDGNYKKHLIDMSESLNLKNIYYFGYIEKKYIPNILKQSDFNYFYFKETSLVEYGISLNKIFDYFASAKPIITNLRIEKLDYFPPHLFLNIDEINFQECSKDKNYLINLSKKIQSGYNSKLYAKYDYPSLTNQLAKILFE